MKLKVYCKIFLLCISACFVFAACAEKGPSEYVDLNPANLTPPVIQSISPSSGYLNDTVTITGTGFNTNPDYNFVIFGSKKATILSCSGTELKVVLPAIVNDTVQVKAAIKGAVKWSSSVDFVFKNVIEVIDEGINDASGVAVDDQGNVYVGSIADRCIYKITPGGEKSVFVSDIDIDGAIHFGPGSYLFACLQNSNKIVRISPDGSSVEDFAVVAGNPIDFDWDRNGNMYVVMNWDGIYKLDSQSNFTKEADISDAVTCRVFEDYLYVCNSWSGQVIKLKINDAGSLEEETRFSANETTMGIEVDQNGTVYYDRYWTPSLFTIDASGNANTLFQNQLINPMRYLYYHNRTLYAVQNEGVDSGGGTPGKVLKIYTGINQAPNYGRR